MMWLRQTKGPFKARLNLLKEFSLMSCEEQKIKDGSKLRKIDGLRIRP